MVSDILFLQAIMFREMKSSEEPGQIFCFSTSEEEIEEIKKFALLAVNNEVTRIQITKAVCKV